MGCVWSVVFSFHNSRNLYWSTVNHSFVRLISSNLFRSSFLMVSPVWPLLHSWRWFRKTRAGSFLCPPPKKKVIYITWSYMAWSWRDMRIKQTQQNCTNNWVGFDVLLFCQASLKEHTFWPSPPPTRQQFWRNLQVYRYGCWQTVWSTPRQVEVLTFCVTYIRSNRSSEVTVTFRPKWTTISVCSSPGKRRASLAISASVTHEGLFVPWSARDSISSACKTDIYI